MRREWVGQIIDRGGDGRRQAQILTNSIWRPDPAKNPEYEPGTRIGAGSAIRRRTLNCGALHKIDTIRVLSVGCPTKGNPNP